MSVFVCLCVGVHVCVCISVHVYAHVGVWTCVSDYFELHPSGSWQEASTSLGRKTVFGHPPRLHWEG